MEKVEKQWKLMDWEAKHFDLWFFQILENVKKMDLKGTKNGKLNILNPPKKTTNKDFVV